MMNKNSHVPAGLLATSFTIPSNINKLKFDLTQVEL